MLYLGRPKKKEERFSEVVVIRMTPSQKSQLDDVANAANLNRYEVIRRQLGNLKIPHRETLNLTNELRVLRQELGRQGGLLKNLYNTSPVNAEASLQLLKQQEKIIIKIGLLVEKIESEKIEGFEHDHSKS